MVGGATQQKVTVTFVTSLALWLHVDLGAKMASSFLKVVLSVLVNSKNAAAFKKCKNKPTAEAFVTTWYPFCCHIYF